MRLLHTEALFVEDFTGRKPPEYAILSHRWGSDEVSLQELRCFTESDKFRRETLAAVFDVDISRQNSKKFGKGWEKINRACSFVLDHGFNWIWIDTCCINKESSAELSEAINSMFTWYQGAAKCYVYLSDVTFKGGKGFEQSEWFSRGWTLQELLAPPDILFLDADFIVIGSKKSLAANIEAVTGISASIVRGQSSMYDESIATRMSWAARRSTTRSEDIAYSLLGIFNINMALLYGEGAGAFRRLQEEIIRNSDDETIFAHTHDRHGTPSALAYHPREFLRHKKVIRGLPPRFANTSTNPSSYVITNKGVQMAPAFVELSPGEYERAIMLNCHFEGQDYPMIIPIAVNIAINHMAGKAVISSTNVWRIMMNSSSDDAIEKAKTLMDQAFAPGRNRPKSLFARKTIYLWSGHLNAGE